MPEGGRLTIDVILVPASKEPACIEIRVRDTGTGIPPEIRERIFEPFFTTKEMGKGTGLGLSLVRDVVKEHQAHLEVVSERGEGTTFTIRLPVNARLSSPRPDGAISKVLD